ncbi:MAG: hypothetical protein NW241_01435 [Bacteroidia bacterium]|nr:hypothetical protein [Bacteroidia bacterium]
MRTFPLLPGLMAGLLLLMSSCIPDDCEETVSPRVADAFFTVTYQRPDGTNYLTSIYNPDGIVVFLDSTGGARPNPRYELIRPGYADGSFGPFRFTADFVSPADNSVNLTQLFGRVFQYDYYLKKDTYGLDTLRVRFVLGVDECRYFWQSIQYFRNGDPLTAYENNPAAAIVVVE